MAEFYRVNDDNVIGGPARLLIAAITYPRPKQLSEIVNLSTYNPNLSTYGWVDIGGTEAGVSFDHQATAKDWRNDQFGLFKKFPLDYTANVQAIALETTQANRVALAGGSIGTDDPTVSESITYYEAATFFVRKRVAVLNLDEFGRIHARVFPLCSWDGKAIRSQFMRGNMNTIDFNFEAHPSEDALGPNGFRSFQYDIDSA